MFYAPRKTATLIEHGPLRRWKMDFKLVKQLKSMLYVLCSEKDLCAQILDLTSMSYS